MSLREVPLPRWVGVLLVGVVGVVGLGPGVAQAPKPAADIPSAETIADLLRREPITLQTWPAWRGRLLGWIGDRSNRTGAAYQAARDFVRGQANAAGELPPPLDKDALAWYFLGSAWLHEAKPGAGRADSAARAERALRRSIQLDPKFARAYRNLAMALVLQGEAPEAPPGQPGVANREQEAQQALAEAARLDPGLSLGQMQGWIALRQKRLGPAEQHFRKALREDPDDEYSARGLAYAIVMSTGRQGKRAPELRPLLDRFPHNGVLVCFNAVALYRDDEPRAAARELRRARKLGTDPTAVIGEEGVRAIEDRAAPGLLERAGWTMLYFAGFYAAVMALMAGAGLVLAGRTRGSKALKLLGRSPDELVLEGQVARTRDESALAKLYAFTLFLGLVLFYLAIPFILAGLLAATCGALYLIFLIGRIPVKLVILIVVIGGGLTWAVFKSLFARPGSGSFGLLKSEADCPRLHQMVREVARRVDTEPADEVYLAPGSSIGVHQEGRGPFGVFGVKKRVLTLGVSTMHFLSVSELKAILAHEYAHFSHRDTYYSRFIYQVDLSIGEALRGMGGAAGKLNYGHSSLIATVRGQKQRRNLLRS